MRTTEYRDIGRDGWYSALGLAPAPVPQRPRAVPRVPFLWEAQPNRRPLHSASRRRPQWERYLLPPVTQAYQPHV